MNTSSLRHPARSALLASSLVVALLLGLIGLGVPSSGASTSSTACATRWGSLAKEAAPTKTGVVTSVRAGRHTCFDRFVVDIDGDAPGYRVEYVRRLQSDGSGKRVAVEGGAVLRIIVRAPGYDDSGSSTIDPAAVDSTRLSGFRTFRDVAWAGSFEGQTTIGLGVRARLPMRAFVLDGPGDGSRLVIDVAHRW